MFELAAYLWLQFDCKIRQSGSGVGLPLDTTITIEIKDAI